jgi:hypothetical protein
MKDFTARISKSGDILLDITVGHLEGTLTMSTGDVTISAFNAEAEEFNMLSSVTGKATYKVEDLTELAALLDTMRAWEPSEPDFTDILANREDASRARAEQSYP